MKKKELLRKFFREKRDALCLKRREQAKESLFSFFLPKIEKASFVLSFSPIFSEIDLSSVNEMLCKEKKLVLPRVDKKGLMLFWVQDLKRDLILSPLSVLEPNPSTCLLLSFSKIDFALIPGLVFDKKGHRIGYGRGYYDRFLRKTSLTSFGVGFKEQFFSDSLPISKEDQKLEKVVLF